MYISLFTAWANWYSYEDHVVDDPAFANECNPLSQSVSICDIYSSLTPPQRHPVLLQSHLAQDPVAVVRLFQEVLSSGSAKGQAGESKTGLIDLAVGQNPMV